MRLWRDICINCGISGASFAAMDCCKEKSPGILTAQYSASGIYALVGDDSSIPGALNTVSQS